MQNMIKDRLNSEKFLLKAGTVLFLLGFLLFNVSEVSAEPEPDPCSTSQIFAASTLNARMVNANSEVYGWGSFDILRNGELDSYVSVTPPAPLPENTVLKVFLNGTELGLMHRSAAQGSQSWYWTSSPPVRIVKVGDVMTITKDGQPYVSGTFFRYIYNWAYIDGSITDDDGNCSDAWGFVYLPSSQRDPRRLGVFPYVVTNSPVTRITLNEASLIPGGIGTELAEIPISGSGSPSPAGLWYTVAENDDIRLTPTEYKHLQMGLLTINTFTQSQPEGYSQIPLNVYFINAFGDFEGDGQADLAVFRPSQQTWYLLYSSNNEAQSVQFGLPTDKVVIGDYDHDGKTDITSFQVDNPDYKGQGVWKIRSSTDNSINTIQWGLPDDIPLSMDIDGNNTSDLTVFRPSTGTWYIRRMGDIIKPRNAGTTQNYSRFVTLNWGIAGDTPLAGDFDADGKEEIAVFRPSEGNWYIYNATTGNYQILHWGMNGDIPIAKDFDGDARADLTVYRPSNGTWYILSSLENSLIARQFGLSGDIPVPADFDKDGVNDIALYRPSNGTWYVTRSSDNSFFAAQFGANGDIPALAAH